MNGFLAKCSNIFLLTCLQISEYLNRQNMNFELGNQESEMQLVARLPGRSLCRIPPKLSLEDVQLDVNFDVVSQNNSQRQLPKFPTLRRCQKPNSTKLQSNQASASRAITQGRITTEQSQYQRKKPKSSIVWLIQIVIWSCYFIATAQNKFQSLDVIGVINIAGVSISVFYWLYKTFILHLTFQFSDFLHGVSLATTLTLYLYTPTNTEDHFKDVLVVIRSCRLFFPLNFDYTFKDLIHKYFLVITKLLKKSLQVVMLVVFFSLIMQQSSYGTLFNRCRPALTSNFSQIFAVAGSELCGSQQCQDNYTCYNPQSYDIIPNSQEVYNNSALSFGFFSFSTVYMGAFSILSLGTLSQTVYIITMYSKSLESYFLAVISVLVMVVVQYKMYEVVVKAVSETTKQHLYQLSLEDSVAYQAKKEVKLRILSQKSLQGYSNHLTFGFISNRQGTLLKKSSHSLKLNKSQAQSINKSAEVKQQLIKPQKQAKTKQQPTIIQNIQTEQKQDSFQSFEIIKVLVYGCIGLVHLVLSVLFTTRCLSQMPNRLIGITLCCIFILWTFKIFLQVYSKHFDEDQQDQNLSSQIKESYELIGQIEVVLYLVALFDYICRVFQQEYILQSASPLTPLFTALLCLRVVYFFLVINAFTGSFQSITKMVKIFIKTAQSLMTYIFFITILCAILSTFTSNLLSTTTYFDKISIYFSIIINSNWLQHYRNLSSNMTDFFAYVFATNFLLIAIGEFIIIKLILSQGIVCSCCEILKKNVQYSFLEIESEPSEEQTAYILQQQKSLFFFQFKDGLRNSLYTLIQSGNYQEVKIMLLKAYLWITFLGYIIDKSSDTYRYLLLSIDIVLLCDSLLSVLALGFWGKCSFVNNQWYNFANFFITFALIVNSFKFFIDCFFLRPFRVLLLLRESQEFKNSYTILKNMVLAFGQILPFLVILLLFNFALCSFASLQQTTKTVTQISWQSLVNAFLMLQKGFDLQKTLQIQNNPFSLYNFQSSLYFILISMSLNAFLIALMLRQLIAYEEQEEKISIKQIQQVSNASASPKTPQQINQQEKIAQQILSMQPQISLSFASQQSFLMKLCKQDYFYYSKLTACALDGLILLILGYLGGTFNQSVTYNLKIARLFFYILEILLFFVQSVAFECNLDNFALTTFIYIITIPGNFIMLVPFHKIYASNGLKSVLTIFVSLPPLTLINLYNYIKPTSLLSKCEKSVNFLTWFFIAGWFFAAILSLCLPQDFLLIFAYVVLGFFGANFNSFIDPASLSLQNQVIANVINVGVMMAGLVLSNGLIAVILFQLSDSLKEKIEGFLFSRQKSSAISRNKIRKLFCKQSFLQTWNKLDLEGSGILSYSLVLHNLPKFMKALSSSSYYTQFLLLQKEEAFLMKLHMLKRLKLPVRTLNKEYEENKRQTCYVITLYDLAARLICLALQYDFFNKVRKNIIPVEPNTMDIKYLCSYLEFDTAQWNEEVSRCISRINGCRLQNGESEAKVSLQKKVDLDSWSLASVLQVLPKLRSRIGRAKAKFE